MLRFSPKYGPETSRRVLFTRLVVQGPMSEIEHLKVAQINKGRKGHSLDIFASDSRGMTLPSTNRNQCCLLCFGVTLRIELDVICSVPYSVIFNHLKLKINIKIT